MSGTATISPIKAAHVAWAFDLMGEWGATGATFYVFPDGEHIIVSDAVVCYRLPKSGFERLAEYMSDDAVALYATAANGIRSDGVPLETGAYAIIKTALDIPAETEECTLLPIGLSEPYGKGCTTFCVSDSGRVEIVQTQYLGPVDTLDGVTFVFDSTDIPIRAIQGDLCIAAIMPIRPTGSDQAMRSRAITEHAARAAYEFIKNEVA